MAYTLAKIDIREIKENQPTGVNTYQLEPGLIPITVEGYSQIADSTEPLIDEWSYFPTEKQLKINNDGVQANQYIDYSLLCSNKNSANYPLDPLGVGTKYIWPPYLRRSPNVVESGKNILEGLISYNTISVELQSGETENIRKFLGSNYSIVNLDFSLWRITNTGSIFKIYSGIGNELKFGSTSVTYSARPKIKLLDEPALYDMNISNPWFNDGEKDQIPIICASIIPYSKQTVDGVENPNGSTINKSWTTQQTYNKSSLLKIKGDWKINTLEVWHGITFADFNSGDYSDCSYPNFGSFNNVTSLASIDRFKQENITNLRVLNSMLKTSSATSPLWSKARHPLDSGVFSDNKEVVFYHAYSQDASSPAQDIMYTYSKATFSNATYAFNALTPNKRFKHLFTNNDNYIEYAADTGSNINPGTSATSQNAPRIMPYSTLDQVWEFKAGIGTITEARMTAFSYSLSGRTNNLVDWFFDINDTAAGDGGSFDIYVNWQVPVGHASLSMENFLEATLKVAFAGATPDLTELDFDESMQMIEYTNQSYRQLLEKMLSSIGYFVTYDQVNEVPKLIKIDPTKAVSDTLEESDFSNLSISLNTNDTYESVTFRNESMMQGDNTRDDYDAYDYNITFGAANDLNRTKKEKIINMLTMESSRDSEIATWHQDNKFDYKFNTSADDRFLNLKIGDTIYLNSSQVPEASGQAKLLINKITTGETQIGFEAIKFASIN